MSYEYEKEKLKLFTPDGFEILTKIYDKSIELSGISGAFTLESVIGGCTGDTWTMLAAVDYLTERGELKCIYSPGSTQKKVYIRTYKEER